MAEDDFDIEGLAAYLHMSSPQVSKMADRGQIPGRKVAGGWRFSPPEIHHWLEARIGALDDDELLQLEDRLQKSQPAAPGDISIAELLPREAIAIPLAARTRSSVIASMIDLAAQTGWLWDPEKMLLAVRNREDMYPTALDNGIALLHPRRPMPGVLAQPFLAFGRTDRGIAFSGQRGVLTDLFFLILSVGDTQHLRVLARLSRVIAAPATLDDLRQASTADEVIEIIRRQEESLRDEA